MAKVYVVQEMNFDFRKAEEFGELVFLSDGRDDFHNLKNSQHNERLVAHLRQGLRGITPDDFIVLVGSPYVQAAAMATLGLMGVNTLNLLRWDNRDMVYIPLSVKLT